MLRRSLRRIAKRSELEILKGYPILTWEVYQAQVRAWLDGQAAMPPIARLDLLDGFEAELNKAMERRTRAAA